MIEIITRAGNLQQQLDHLEEGCWANLNDPTDEEIEHVSSFFQIEQEWVMSALDEEESARIESEDNTLLVVVDIPLIQKDNETAFTYMTIPLGIILCNRGIITVCSREATVLEPFISGHVRSFSTNKKTRFLLQILYRNASKFLQYLKQIDKASNMVENELHKSMKNRELIQMMRLEKSLVYFSTSLKGNEVVLEKLVRSRAITRYEDDEDLLEDVIIENKQAIEMCTIYRDILSGTMDAFASIISNNLNIVMKWLAVVTIVLSVPQIVFSLFGINTPVPWENHPLGFWFVIIIGGISTVISIIYMWRKKMF